MNIYLKYLLMFILVFSFALGCLFTGYWYGYATHAKVMRAICTSTFLVKFPDDPDTYGCMKLQVGPRQEGRIYDSI